jgi:hypothetical protein
MMSAMTEDSPHLSRGAVSLAGIALRFRDDLASGRPEPDMWRLLYGFADDFRGSDETGKRSLIAQEPPLTGHQGLDATLAGMAEFFAREAGMSSPPPWVSAPSRFAEPWYWIASHTWQHAYVLTRTPIVFKRHGVFIARENFDRA